MSRLFYHVMQDNAGNLLFDVSGTMRIAGTGTLATIYGDEALTVILPNPMTNHPSFGSFKCFLGVGDYDFYMAKGGYTFETLTGVQGHGTMAQQDASAVGITGGTATFTDTVTAPRFDVPNAAGEFQTAFQGRLLAGANRWNLFCDGTAVNYIEGGLGIGSIASIASTKLKIWHDKTFDAGMIVQPTITDTGGAALVFNNISGVSVGAIQVSSTATAYNTTSDARLKEDVQPLDGALDVLRALNPVSFLWKADGSPGRGFLAHEVAEVVDGVIVGEKDAVDEEGNILPQMIDYSKLVPYLIGAVKELTQQVEMLTAQLAAASA